MLLASMPGVEVVAETGDGVAVEALVAEYQPDLLVLDLDLPGRTGLDIARSIKAKFEKVKILILTGNGQPDAVRRAFGAGADGYILKVDDNTEIATAVMAVLGGRMYVGRQLAVRFEQDREPRAAAPGGVTPREGEILRLIADGFDGPGIARQLHISVETVRTHRKNVMAKLDLHNIAEITAYVIQMAAKTGG